MSDLVIDEVRSKILHTLEDITPFDSIEDTQLNNTIAWVKSNEPIFRISKPDNPAKHLVSYFVVYDSNCNKILLVDHRNAELWLPTGGHVEIDEDPMETVSRECLEELGITADFWHRAPIFVTQTTTVGKTAGHIDVSLWYVIKGSSDIELNFDKQEFKGIKWFALNEIPYERSDPHMRRFVSKFKYMLKN